MNFEIPWKTNIYSLIFNISLKKSMFSRLFGHLKAFQSALLSTVKYEPPARKEEDEGNHWQPAGAFSKNNI